jgi:hypothetical protein
MVTDQQVRRLMTSLQKQHDTLALAAAKAGMSENTARKWRRLADAGGLPSQSPSRAEHTWRTRIDPFAAVWPDIVDRLRQSPGLQAKTVFEDLQRRFPGQFNDGQLRTLQRQIKRWRALEGPPKEVFFAQEHHPGVLCASDFTHLSSLKVTIGRRPFDHLLYHFVLTYSNWETGMICFSESFENLSEGLQRALRELGGVPVQHRTDRLSAAVQLLDNPINAAAGRVAQFTEAYTALLRHYGLEGQKIRAGKANENGDVEQRHHRLRTAIDQALLLRGSRDFESREAYDAFLVALLAHLNAGRQERLAQERPLLRPLPATALPWFQRLLVRVGPGSTIRVKGRVYSVPSRLIGERVEARLGAETVEVFYAQQRVACLPRAQGKEKHRVSYRHVIDWLVRKPGAFENYRYREDLFPTSHFRIAYDALTRALPGQPVKASAAYLRILELAAKETEAGVEAALRYLLARGEPISVGAVADLVRAAQVDALPPPTAVTIAPVDLSLYDGLLGGVLPGEAQQAEEEEEAVE